MSYVSPRAASIVHLSEMQSEQPEAPRPRIRDRIIVGGMGGGGGTGVLQALLTEMSGLKKPRGFINRYVRRALGIRPKPPPKYRILMMMATNMPQSLDQALMRPGRIDRIFKVGYPSKKGRIATYEGYLSKVRHSLTPSDIDRLATITPYATGASIKDLINEALIESIRDGREWVTWEDIVRARMLKSLGPPEGVEYIERERHATAIHEAAHAVVAYRVRHHFTIDLATIEKGQDYLGMVSSIPMEEQFTNWRSEFESDVMVSLAGLVGERMFFDGDSSSGVSSDLNSATTLAMYMEGYWGMGTTIGSHAVVKRPHGAALTSDASRAILETELGRRIEQKLHDLMDKTEQILRDNRRQVLALAHALEANRTLTGDDVVAVIEGRKGTLIDGRPYGSKEFLDAAEQYHSRVLQAHKEHGHVDIPLPSLSAPSTL